MIREDCIKDESLKRRIISQHSGASLISDRLCMPLFQGTRPSKLSESQLRAVLEFEDALRDGRIKTRHVTTCPCGADTLEMICVNDRFGLEFSTYLCTNCGLLITNPQLSSQSIPTYYAEYYRRLHFKDDKRPPEALFKVGQGSKIYRILTNFGPFKRGARVLDVGGGTGSVIREFKAAARKDGIKIDATVLDHHPPENTDSIECICGGLKDLRLNESGSFDVIIMSHVLEHFVDFAIELEYLSRVIHEDTLIYIEVPGIFRLNYSAEYNSDFRQYFTSAHIHHFTYGTLCYHLSRLGFRPLWGNEAVESIFIKGKCDWHCEEESLEIIRYLRGNERNLPLLQALQNADREISILKRKMTLIEEFGPVRLARRLRKMFQKNR